MLVSAWITRLPGESPVMPLLCNSPTRSGNQPVIDAIRTTGLVTDQPPHPNGVTYLQPPPGPSFSSIPLASRSRPHRRSPFRCLHHPAIRFPRHHERSRRDRQPEPCSRGPRDRQDPNQTQPPGRAQTHRLEEQPRRTDPPPPCPPSFVQPHRHPTLRQPTQRYRWGSRMRYHAGIPGSSRLHTPDYTHPRST